MARVRGRGLKKKNGMKEISEGGIKKKSFCGKEDIPRESAAVSIRLI